ncbi:MAG: TetR/AcrR family transcriptional regulator, partial [Lachnospiraceae bacterium]|nr:TetR/AcrR family transcriptional regulator [Lachnospiraceae bacterium]
NNMLRRQFDAGVRVIEKLIESGIASGEFYCENPKGAAANIMYVLEGMKINAQTFGITEKMVDEQLLYIMQGLIIEV